MNRLLFAHGLRLLAEQVHGLGAASQLAILRALPSLEALAATATRDANEIAMASVPIPATVVRRLAGRLGARPYQHELAAVQVRFRDLSDAAIEAYLQAEQPYDCAGSAKSEGLGIALLESIDNDDPTALVGLPLIRTCRLLRQADLPVW